MAQGKTGHMESGPTMLVRVDHAGGVVPTMVWGRPAQQGAALFEVEIELAEGDGLLLDAVEDALVVAHVGEQRVDRLAADQR